MADLASLSREELIELIMTQQRMIEDQQRQIAELREEIEQLRRGGKRQAAPFSKGKRVENPKPPGRKPGQGPFSRRAAPLEEATETISVPAPECCPHCGGDLEQEREDRRGRSGACYRTKAGPVRRLSLIHISEPTRLGMISYA